MKTKITLWVAVLVMLFGISSCSNSSSDTAPTEISVIEKEAIKKAISERIQEIINGANALDVGAAAKPYADDTDFKIVNPDGTVTGFQTMKSIQAEGFRTLAVMDFKTIKQDFTFLANNIVICTWTGINEFELKTGEKMKIDPYVGTLVFKKIAEEWKIVYAHETAATPTIINNNQ